MKKFILGLIAAITVATIAYAAGPTVLTALTLTGNLIVGGTVTSTGVIAGEIASQSDTNATTTATGYTPAATGQMLFGGAGTGTNAIWISKGTTTNDWVQVAP